MLCIERGGGGVGDGGRGGGGRTLTTSSDNESVVDESKGVDDADLMDRSDHG